jgi:predicted phage terminase large subunit-like protein
MRLPPPGHPKSNRSTLNFFLREDFVTFVRKAFVELCPGSKFYDNWHIAALSHQLGRVFSGDSRRLIVNMPPRHLKSIVASVAFVAWALGRAPKTKFICLSYSNELSGKLARDCRQIMESEWYKRAFPGTALIRATETELETSAGGGRFTTSICGTLTGRGADIIIIDDPMKADDAMSETARRQAQEWTTSTLFSRLNDKRTGAIILVMQRLHQDDLAGYLLESEGWEHLNLPAICEEEQVYALGYGKRHVRRLGDVLHADRESFEILQQIRAEVGTSVFSAQYQQAPIPAGGALIQRHWFGRYETAPRQAPGDQIAQSWDTASKPGVDNDYSVCVTVLIRGSGDLYVLNVFRAKMDYPELLRAVAQQAERFDPDVVLIEDAASGQQLIQSINNGEVPNITAVIPRKPEGDKIIRMAACTALMEARQFVLPTEAPWLMDYERELLGFPFAKHDDQADATSQLISWYRQRPKPMRLDFSVLDKLVDHSKPDWSSDYR